MSKFKNVLDAAKHRTDTPIPDEQAPEAPAASTSASRRPGRPPGKRSDPDYMQQSIYIRKATNRAVQIALLQHGDERDLSEVVEDLLTEWLRTTG